MKSIPWTIGMGWEQEEPGFYITDKDGAVIFAENEPGYELGDEEIQLLEALLKAVKK